MHLLYHSHFPIIMSPILKLTQHTMSNLRILYVLSILKILKMKIKSCFQNKEGNEDKNYIAEKEPNIT